VTDPIDSVSAPQLHWTRTNVGEAMPGVQTPLSWTVWASALEVSLREAMFAIGAFTAGERAVPADPNHRAIRIFRGRVAMNVEFLTGVGDRMPGTTGAKTAETILGSLPSELHYQPTRRRYPIVAYRLPRAFLLTPGRIERFARDTEQWYSRAIAGVTELDLAAARTRFAEANARFIRATILQTIGVMGVIQPMYDALTALITRAGVGDIGVLSGTGGAEMAVVADIWKAAHGQLEFTEAVRRHGFHGPLEGELSSRVWREDPVPLARLLSSYADRPDPTHTEEPARLADMRAELLGGLPRHERPPARLILRLAPQRILSRGIIKRSFLQCFDVARASARRAGVLLAEARWLADPEDVFYLTVDELQSVVRDVSGLVRERRLTRTAYQGTDLPAAWRGQPEPVTLEPDLAGNLNGTVIQGLGVSSGVVEGTARVVHDPAVDDVQDGEILIAPYTDPSWCSIMFISAGLVVDIGGALSHAAVVAREMGIPCVVSTSDASRRIRTGDQVRVDGGSGRVELLRRAPADASSR
jgi:phosphohistidine swiveling domain-containing protein